MSDNNQIEQIKQFLYNEICERREYSASRMCEEVLKFIEQMDNNETPNLKGLSKIFWGDSNTCDVTFYPKDDDQAMIDYNKMEEEWEMDNYNEMKDEQQ